MTVLIRTVRALATLALLSLGWSPALPAQSTSDTLVVAKPALFAYLQLGDTVAFEAVRSDNALAQGVFLVPKQGRIAWDHFLVDGAPAGLRLTVYPGEDPNLPAVSETDFEPRGDSMLVITRDPERVDRDMRAAAPNAIPSFGRSMLHLAYLAFHAAQSRRDSLTLFLTSSGRTVTAGVIVQGETVVITVEGLRVETNWKDGALHEIRVPEQGLTVVRMPAVPE